MDKAAIKPSLSLDVAFCVPQKAIAIGNLPLVHVILLLNSSVHCI